MQYHPANHSATKPILTIQSFETSKQDHHQPTSTHTHRPIEPRTQLNRDRNPPDYPYTTLQKPQTATMSARYAFTKSLKEVRFLFCQTSEQSAAVR